jgi:molecular chaperone IbpA
MSNHATITSADIFSRQFIGFDRLFDHLTSQESSNYPPHNVVITGDDTRTIEFALAGFTRDDVNITVEDAVLTISSESLNEEEDRIFIHKGISARSFVKRFSLAEYWEVSSAEFQNGILTISLKQEIPEAKKRKDIEIDYKS